MQHKATLLLLGLMVLISHPAFASEPAFSMYRWKEDYRYLADKPDKSHYEKLKYTPLGERTYLSFGGSLRERLNVYDNDRFGLAGPSDGHLLLHRMLIHADLHLNERVRTFVELGSHLTDGHSLRPGPFDEDSADITQAFADVKLMNTQLRLGRQEMALGSARLVGLRDGPNLRRAFDGMKLDTHWNGAKIQLLALQEVAVEEDGFDNESNGDETLWGIYNTFDAGVTQADMYYLGLYRGGAGYAQGMANEARHTLGTRLFGAHERWDWNVELAYQFGEFGASDIGAWTAASVSGYTLEKMPWTPRLALSANIASGDDDPNDNRLGTFNPLYPNLAYFEEAAILAPQNFFNIEPEITVYPHEDLSLSLDWNFFWRLEKRDAVYTRGLMPLPGTANAEGHFVAHVPSISIDYQLTRHLAADISYSHFFAGEVIENAGGNDVDFFKAELTWTF